jgi:hypothetical protein
MKNTYFKLADFLCTISYDYITSETKCDIDRKLDTYCAEINDDCPELSLLLKSNAVRRLPSKKLCDDMRTRWDKDERKQFDKMWYTISVIPLQLGLSLKSIDTYAEIFPEERGSRVEQYKRKRAIADLGMELAHKLLNGEQKQETVYPIIRQAIDTYCTAEDMEDICSGLHFAAGTDTMFSNSQADAAIELIKFVCFALGGESTKYAFFGR